ncbi:MAG: DUF3987 domain-containing protein [Bacteroidaceae bacterium]|nr:DUF3987 domain-containing protein [Bacteroidaceae bacterium]
MSCYQVFTQNGAKIMRPVPDREEYLKLRGSRSQNILVSAVRNGEEDKKRLLLQMNYSCLPNEDGTLKGATRMSTSVGMDIDHIPQSHMQMLKETILEKKDELGLLMLELSARGEGYHLVFRRRPDLTQEENLHWASDLLGVDFDKGAKDITRVFFTTTDSEEDLIYLDDELFQINQVKSEERRTENAEGVASGTRERSGNESNPCDNGNSDSSLLTLHSSLPQALPASLTAFDLCVRQAGLKPDEMDVWGEHNWHNNLMAVLSVGVAKLMSRQNLEAVIRERLPNYSQTEDCKKLVDYFYDKYSADTGFMSASLRDINAKAQEVPQVEPASEASGGDLESLTQNWNPPTLPAKLPRLIQLLIKPFPKEYHPVLVVTACVVLGTIASHFRSTYIDGRGIAANLYAAIIAESGKGKSWVTILLELMCRHTLQTWDDQEWKKVRENQELRDKKSNAKDKPARYHPKLRIMETMSKTSLLEVQTNLGENGMILCNYTESDELANASRVQFSNLSVLLRKAWDLDTHRQFYMSEASCNTQTRLNAAILLTGTPRSVLARLFSDTESGMMQRFIPMIIPTLKRTFRPPKYMPLNPDEAAERDSLLVSLWQKDLALGDDTLDLEMPKTQKMIQGWYDELEERYNDGELTEAEADLSHRVGQFMQRAAIPFVALYEEEQKEVIDLVRWVGNFAYYNICHIFASRVTQDMKESNQMLQNRDARVTAEPLLSLMPEVFTVQQFREERVRRGQSGEVRMLLSRYVKKGKLKRLQNGVFRKIVA